MQNMPRARRQRRSHSRAEGDVESADEEEDVGRTTGAQGDVFHVADIEWGDCAKLSQWLFDTTPKLVAQEKLPLVTIDSNGGLVDTALAMADLLAACPVQVRVLVLSRCWSAAMALFVAVPHRQRFALPTSSFMVHFGVCNVEFRSVQEMQSEIQHRLALDKIYNRRVSRGCARLKDGAGGDAGVRSHHNIYFTARDAHAWGLLPKRPRSSLRKLMAHVFDANSKAFDVEAVESSDSKASEASGEAGETSGASEAAAAATTSIAAPHPTFVRSRPLKRARSSAAASSSSHTRTDGGLLHRGAAAQGQ